MSVLIRKSLSRLSISQRLAASAICCRDRDSVRLESRRGMAETRSYPIRGASHETGITEEVRDLIRNMKHAENIETWEREEGAPEPIRFDYLRPNPEDMDNDQELPMVYYPHRGEDLSAWHNLEPSPVLIVERVKTLRNEPWWHKETCERFGLGNGAYPGKRVAVPNMSHFTQKLYTVKHLIKITPVSFPDGLPPEDEFDPEAAEVTLDGKFLYHPKLKERSKVIEAGEQNSERMLMQSKTFQAEARMHFRQPWSTPLGNHNYHRNYSKDHPEKTNQITDSAVKFKY